MNPNFDRVARAYRWMEYLSFGPLLERCRFAHLDFLGDPRHALVLGDGDGRFLKRLLQRYPLLIADAVDLSPGMVNLAETRIDAIGAQARVRFHIADARGFIPPQPSAYDLVVAHFFLDCLTDPEAAALLASISPALAPGATFLVSEFAIPRQPLRRVLAQALVRGLYFFFRQLTGLGARQLPDFGTALAREGLCNEDTRLFLGGVLRSERWRASVRVEAMEVEATNGSHNASHGHVYNPST